jgi:hypothetical protein
MLSSDGGHPSVVGKRNGHMDTPHPAEAEGSPSEAVEEQ